MYPFEVSHRIDLCRERRIRGIDHWEAAIEKETLAGSPPIRAVKLCKTVLFSVYLRQQQFAAADAPVPEVSELERFPAHGLQFVELQAGT